MVEHGNLRAGCARTTYRAGSLYSKAIALILIFFLNSFWGDVAYAQEQGPSRKDLLFTKLSTSQPDSNKVKILTGLSSAYIDAGNYDSALYHAHTALELAGKVSFKQGMVVANSCIGNVYMYLSEFRTALQYYEKTLSLNVQMDNKSETAISYGSIGYVYTCLSEHNKALEYFQNALRVFEQLGDKNNAANTLNHIGIVYSSLSEYPKALEYHQKALSMDEQSGNKRGVANDLINIGRVHKMLSDYPMALEYYQKALIINEQLGNKRSLAVNYLNIGVIFSELLDSACILLGIAPADKYLKASEYYQKALIINEQLGNKVGIAYCLNNIGEAHAQLGDYPRALEYYQQSLSLLEEADHHDQLIPLENIGDVYLNAPENALEKMGIIPSERFNKVYEYINRSLHIATETGSLEGQKNAWNLLSEAYEKQNEYGKAYEAYKNYITLRDSIGGEEIKKKITQKEMQFAFEKKETELKYQQQLTEEKLEKQQLFTSQQTQALALINKEKELQHLAYLNQQADLEKEKAKRTDKEKQLNVSEKEKRLQASELKAKQREVEVQNVQRNLFIGGFVVMLLFAGIFLRQRNKTKKEKQRAENSEKFKQQFLANMSHEIRTPMNAIMGMTHLALDTSLNPKQQGYLSGISKASENLLHIIDEILDLSKIEAGKIDLEQIDFSIRDVVEQVKQTLQHKATEKNIELLITVESTVPEIVIGDPVRLNQVLMNLAGNGLKFTEKGSVHLQIKQAQEQIRFSVIDTGIGIPHDKLKSIFESFTQAHSSDTRKYGGTGLGLSISKELIELMGGHISIESEVGSGTTFSFTIGLPVGSKENLLKQQVSEQIDGSILDGLKILLVDDNADNRIVCRDTLESKSNVEIIEASNGKEALEKLAVHDFDIVLMDVQMPVMDGYEATRQIRASFAAPKKDVPVIALTASVIRSDLDLCRAAGMDDYVPKPFKRSQLFTTIATLSNRKIKFVRETVSKANAGPAMAFGHIDLSYLRNFCNGDEAKMQKYMRIFLESIPAWIDNLKTAESENSFQEIASLVHGFKTKLLMMGMDEARTVATELEMECRAENPGQTAIQTGTATLIQIILAAQAELINSINFKPQINTRHGLFNP